MAGPLPRRDQPRQSGATGADHGPAGSACAIRSRLRPTARRRQRRAGDKTRRTGHLEICPDAQGRCDQKLEPRIGQPLQHSHGLGNSLGAGGRDLGQPGPTSSAVARAPASAAVRLRRELGSCVDHGPGRIAAGLTKLRKRSSCSSRLNLAALLRLSWQSLRYFFLLLWSAASRSRTARRV